MKRSFVRLSALITMILLVVSSLGINCAYADTVDDWNRSCRKKTGASTPVYAPNDFDMSGPPICTLPKNTYVKLWTGSNDFATIEYMTADGVKGSGFVNPSYIVSACVFFTDENGERQGINELVYAELYGSNPPSSGNTSNSTNSSNNAGAATQNSSTTRPSGGNTSTTKKTTVEETPLVVTWNDQTVTVKTLGIKESLIVVEKEEQTVATAELVFNTEAEADKVIAVIHAPNTGKCSLRKKASQSAGVITKCKAGTVVCVLQYGKQFCKISYNGMTGYVLTSCLKFYGTEPEVIGTGVLTYNGKATGKTTINIRNAADGDSAKIAELRTGTHVQVFALHDGWYEIEYNGIHGYVMQKFLTIEE